jgi:hypothetical protein
VNGGWSKLKVTKGFIQGLSKCSSDPPFCTRQAVLALMQRLSEGRPPRNRYPVLAEEHGIMTASVGIMREARILVFYIDVDHLTHEQVSAPSHINFAVPS